MIKRILAGITVDDDTLALDAIREVGHGGSYLGADHTLRHFAASYTSRCYSRRQTIKQWIDRGARMAHEVAHARVDEILAKAGPVPLPSGVDAALEQALDHT